ncbi:hypothetical protein FNH09_45235 [Streptomyces adustus]|uniref:Uncharacterized protein n=1 Tax=Streptomyces adustus TaxID=1609272 RepID=A0A5N8VS92_9ACTN|nr:hypothetical protein [Streptomyces adustus]MPY38163.1 hypothetical protein [Streptomyces adustus]
MDVATLILLGATGGVLRGLLDAYARFLDWQTDRRTHRQTGREGEPPRFTEYFDVGVEPFAAVLHSAMGAGAAVLFGTTGQISGAYAAIVVGISAPGLLTQLSRIQSVHDALTAGQTAASDAFEPAVQPTTPQTLPPPASALNAGGTHVEPAARRELNGHPVTAADNSASAASSSTAGRPEGDVQALRQGRLAREGEST